MRRCAPLVVAESGANADGNQTRQEGTHQGYKDVVSRPFEFFSRPECDKVTDPIGARLREFCAFHCPHLLPGQVGALARPGAGNAAGTYRRMLLNDVDAVRSRFVSQLCPPELARLPVHGQDSPTSGVFKVLEIALGAAFRPNLTSGSTATHSTANNDYRAANFDLLSCMACPA